MPGLCDWILVVLDKRSSDSIICGYKNCCLSNDEDGNEGDKPCKIDLGGIKCGAEFE